ncbi:MAG: FecR domain-containing protein [Gemmatimonadaceae bacterium]|nr:FecR domain-containing protein [Gemmatimonadaceae bacterium]
MMDEHDDIDWRIVTRYLAHECTPDEAEIVARWAAAVPMRARELEVLRTAWVCAAELPMERRAPRAFARFAAAAGIAESGARTAAPEPIARDGARPRRRVPLATFGVARRGPRWLSVGVAAAASLIVAVAAGWLWRQHARGTSAVEGSIAGNEFATARAQRASIELLDGTRAVLAPESRLRVAADFGAGHRVVDLVGQAYFVVTHDAKHPFVVRTANAVAEDLGTAFVVRAYPGDSVAEVAVADGKVALRPRSAGGVHEGGAREVTLDRGDVGVAASSGRIAVAGDVDLLPYLGWTTGTLSFHKTPLREVQRVLERWYDVKIELSDSSLASVPVSASFDNKSADQALRSLARLLKVRYERSGASVRFIVDPAPR